MVFRQSHGRFASSPRLETGSSHTSATEALDSGRCSAAGVGINLGMLSGLCLSLCSQRTFLQQEKSWSPRSSPGMCKIDGRLEN